MEANKEPKVHQGRNIRYARILKGIKQEELGRRIGIPQSEVSLLESKEVIAREMLEKVAKALDVDVNFLEKFVPEEVHGTYNEIHDNTVSQTDNASNTVTSSVVDKQEIIDNSVPFSEVKSLFEELANQYKINADLRVLLAKNNIPYNGE